MVDELLIQITEEESERNEEWATDMVRLMIRDAQYLVTKTEYELGYNVLFGAFPKLKLDSLFSGKVMESLKQKLSGSTVYFFEKVRNAIIDERTSSSLNITVNSLDPAKQMLKKQDKLLLQNRKGIDALMDEITSNNGMPPNRITKDDFHGNVEDFDNAGMDDMDEEDVRSFFESKWGLMQEINLQNPLNAIVRTNEVVNNYDKYINDILICMYNTSQVYVDELEGKVKIEHLYPYEVQVLYPTGENTQKGAQGFVVRKSTNVRGLLRRFGDSFKLDDNWKYLLATINNGMKPNNQFKGIYEGSTILYGEGNINECISMRSLLDRAVSYAYAEWRVVNMNTTLHGTDASGNNVSIKYGQRTEQHDGWSVEKVMKEDTYRAYYLDVAASQPKIIKWGKLYMQPIEGAYDELSGFSIIVNRREGIPMATILKPFYNIMQSSFTMFEMLVNDIKPDGYIYNYDSLVKIAEHLQQSKDTPTDIMSDIQDLLKQFQDSPNRITVTPTDDENNTLGGDAFGGVKRAENGLNKAAIELMKIMDWCEQKAQSFLGTQGIEFAEPKDGFKLSLENRRRSRASTQFIDFILLNHLKDVSIIVLGYVQDISKYPEVPAYRYLCDLVGEEIVKKIATYEKSVHRYATYLDTFNNDIQLAEIRDLAKMDMMPPTSRLSLEQYAFICKFDNVNQAIFYLADERRKADKKKLKDQQTLLEQQNSNAEEEFQRQLKLEDKKGEWQRLARAEEAKGYTSAAQLNANASIEKERMRIEGDAKKSGQTAINNLNEIAEKANADSKKPMV
jgi:hypothetical protein